MKLLKRKSFYAFRPTLESNGSESKKFVDSEYGFGTTSRIGARFFTGLVVNENRVSEMDRKKFRLEKFVYQRQSIIKSDSTELNEKEVDVAFAKYQLEQATKIAQELGPEALKYKRFLPIYDTKGNLLWPKQMSYEEVKKFVAEREARKQAELLFGADAPPSPAGGEEKEEGDE